MTQHNVFKQTKCTSTLDVTDLVAQSYIVQSICNSDKKKPFLSHLFWCFLFVAL